MFSQDTRERDKFTRCQEQYPFVFTMQTRWVTFLCMFVLRTIENLGGKKGRLEREGRQPGRSKEAEKRVFEKWKADTAQVTGFSGGKKRKKKCKIKRHIYLCTNTARNAAAWLQVSSHGPFPPPLLIIYWCKQLAHAKQILYIKSQLSEGGSSVWQSALR